MTDDAALQPLVAEQYRRLADLLAALPEEQWDRASLCAGWRVREVVAHVSMPARYSGGEFMAMLGEYGGDFGRLSDDLAAKDAGRPAESLVGDLRSEVLATWTPPGGGHRGALIHGVVHGLDAALPLGRDGHVAPEALRAVLDALAAGGTHQPFGMDLAGRHLVATDLDWAAGDGEPLTAPAEVLVAHLTGRGAAAGRAEGVPLERLAA